MPTIMKGNDMNTTHSTTQLIKTTVSDGATGPF